MMTDKPTLTTAQVAEQLGISHDTVSRLFRSGELRGYRQTQRRNGRLFIYRESVEQYDSQRRNAPQVGI